MPATKAAPTLVSGNAGPPTPPTPPAKKPGRPEFVIIIKNRITGGLHPVMNPRLGPCVMASSEDLEQATNLTTTLPACQKNEFFLLEIA